MPNLYLHKTYFLKGINNDFLYKVGKYGSSTENSNTIGFKALSCVAVVDNETLFVTFLCRH